MKKNSNINIIGSKIILVPYRKLHVPRYHKWMQSQELQELTSSDPLTEMEEYEMQQSWREDENKCTFIVLDKRIMEERGDEIEAMIGDTNLYLVHDVDGVLMAETGIMIADESARKQGMGWEAMLLMLRFGIEELKVLKYIAKIGMSNTKSLRMFRKLGFETESRSDVFKEVTLEKKVTGEWRTWVCQQTENRQIVNTDQS